MEEVWITGMGLVTSIGNDRGTVTRNLLELRHGIERHPELQGEDSPVKIAGTVKEFEVSSPDPEDWEYPEKYRVPRAVLRSFSPHVLYAWCSLNQAIEDASLSEEDLHDPDAGLYTSSGGSMRSIHKHFEKMDQRGVMACNPLAIVASIAGTLTFNLVAALGIRGSSTGLVSACASSGHALGMALDEIRLGRQKRMLVVGAEDCNFESIVPFCGMRALSLDSDPDRASRPFDKTRNGFVGTGGAVSLVLETKSEAQRRGAEPYAKFIGWGQGSDGHNVAISHPEGRGLKRAMTQALAETDRARRASRRHRGHSVSTLSRMHTVRGTTSAWNGMPSSIRRCSNQSTRSDHRAGMRTSIGCMARARSPSLCRSAASSFSTCDGYHAAGLIGATARTRPR